MATQQVLGDVRVHVRNIGGINETTVTLPEGVSVLTGRNATNRTSFLQAIMAGLGSERSTLKGDADEGEVQLRIGDETYTRTLTRADDTVRFDGNPYLEDVRDWDLFAFLIEDNEARRAVERGDDLREIIMRPVDTDRINNDIDRLESTKRNIEDRIEELDRLERELPRLESEREDIESELDTLRSELETVRSELDDHELSIEESQSQRAAIERTFEDVRQARSELEDYEFELDAERETLEELRSERERLAERLDEFEGDEDPEHLSDRIQELRRQKQSVEDTLSQLGSVVSFNEEMLEEDGLELGSQDGRVNGSPTEKLLDNDEVTCWTCGSSVDRDRIGETVERLRELRSETMAERNRLRDRIEDLTSTRSNIRERKRERERVQRRLSELEEEIDDTQARIETLRDTVEKQRDAVERLETKAEAVGTGDDYDEVLELHRRANELELRIERLESDRADVDERLADRRSKLDERDELAERREEISERLTDLRTRVDRLEEESVQQFNDHMESVLAILEYDNIERIWIERREREVREGRRKRTKPTFDLQVVRTTDEGTSYRDSIEHLSESEREVVGLVFALAGYLVHEVYEEVPFMILDSLEAIDSDRIARLVDYFDDYAAYLTVALLPEDAEMLSDDYTYIEQIDA